MTMTRVIEACTLLGLLLTTSVSHAETTQPDEAKAMLETAVDLFNKEGHVKAICAINSDRKSFVKGELYVFVINGDGTIFAHSMVPDLTGLSYKGIRDARDAPFGESIVELAQTRGEGSVEYFWLNYETNKVEKKHTYIKYIEHVDFIVGAGYHIRDDAAR